MSDYLRLAEAPALRHPGYPYCAACDVETRLEDGSWLCESCGTTWPADDMEHPPENAEMYPAWSGEELTGPICPNDVAWRFSHLPPDERDARVREHIAEGGAVR
ncbi:hypothetical protein G6031_09530 [Dietzia sp. CQ4]|uniref:hypothetical protein n=1 Tax=Dietzia sp. (strain CQ4) TaxID=370437 RepID=UPI0015FB05E1|nr:hypothetical protein [Dietzia sp. CQ4]MBB1034628.1 hypothetical protein [Dietzia sp. CQ4]